MSITNPEILARLQQARTPRGKKEPVPIARESVKMKEKKKQEKKLLNGDDTLKEKWFKARRKEMVGVCQCGCAQPSQKKDDLYFRHSAAHIFPKENFESIMYHPLNFVERRFWGPEACHTNMDEGGLDKWPNMADWDDIKEKFYVLAPLLTDAERATKFYSKLESLVYKDSSPIINITKMEVTQLEQSIIELECTKAEKIVKLKAIGKTNKEIAELVGTNAGHVWNVLNKEKLKNESAQD